MALPFFQDHYRWAYDNGTQDTGTFVAAEDTAINWFIDTKVTIRIKIHATAISASTFTLQYSIDGGGYANVPASVPIPPSAGVGFAISDSPNFANQAATAVERLTTTGGGTNYVNGYGMDTAITTPSMAISGNRTELLWCLNFYSQAGSDSMGHTYTFRVTSSAGFTYTKTPSITIVPRRSIAISGGSLKIFGGSLKIKGS